jgi:ribosomal protein S18 acetylase RimI-like enzyme
MEPKSTNIHIRKATPADVDVLLPVARQTLMESHGHSASPADMASYLERKMTRDPLVTELSDEQNHFYLLFENETLVGYAKMIFDVSNPNTSLQHLTKLERIYLLASHHGRQLAQQLFNYLIEIMRTNGQVGVWLHVWKENPRAIAFYQRNGFEIIGEYDFEVSATHSNPNYVLYKAIASSPDSNTEQ